MVTCCTLLTKMGDEVYEHGRIPSHLLTFCWLWFLGFLILLGLLFSASINAGINHGVLNKHDVWIHVEKNSQTSRCSLRLASKSKLKYLF